VNKWESDQWAKATREQSKISAKKALEQNGSSLTEAIKLVLQNCSLSKETREELGAELKRDEAKTLELLNGWDRF
jgi:hypothetical protein